MSRSLLSYDISGIQRYVFATDRLREVRGASALLDELNRDDLTRAAQQADSSLSMIFAGGGAGLLEVATEQSQAVIEALHRTCKEKTDASTLHTASIELDGTQPFPELFQTLHARLRIAKGTNPQFVAVHSHSFLRTCDSCAEHYASESDPDEREDKMVCRACSLKIDRSKKIKNAKEWSGFWRRLQEKLPKDASLEGLQRPEDLNELCPNRQDMALIYADGDGLGNIFETCKTSQEVGTRSKSIETALLGALAGGVGHVLHGYKERTLPFDIFLLGGDDLVLAIRAKHAFPLATTLMEEFAHQSGGLTLSVGIAIAHAHYPLRDLIDLAKDALRHAKRARYLRARSSAHAAEGMLSYAIASNLSHADLDADYDGELTNSSHGEAGTLRRTLRPYTARELRQLLKVTQSVISVLPRTKVEALRTTAFLDTNAAVFEGLSAMLRVPPAKREKVYTALRELDGWELRDFPWLSHEKDLANPWADIADLADFVSISEDLQ